MIDSFVIISIDTQYYFYSKLKKKLKLTKLIVDFQKNHDRNTIFTWSFYTRNNFICNRN